MQLAEAAGEVAVGDWLVLDAENNGVIQRLERQTVLVRKASGEQVRSQIIATNLDTIFVVSSCNKDFNLSRIEKYLALAMRTGATPIIALTKAALCDDPATLRQQAEQLHAELLVELLDARRTAQAEVLRPWCGPGQTIALVGPSGVGKSTPANALGAGSPATGEVRRKDAKGRHTTTSRSLHLLPSGGILVDTPGVRELQLPACEDGLTDLLEGIVDIAANCRVTNCRHEADAGCAVAAALASGRLDERRYASFRKLIPNRPTTQDR